MLRAWIKRWHRKSSPRAKAPASVRLQLETLEARCVPTVTEAWVSGGAFGYFITSMPDIDQRREPVDPFLLGLPNNGGMYCVPTATMNELAYIANHGFAGVGPGANDWQLGPPDNFSVYNTMSADLYTLGSMMGTDPVKGTNGFGAQNGAQAWLDSYAPGDFAVSCYFIHGTLDSSGFYPSDTYAPNLTDMAMQAIDGNLIAPGVGWYSNADTDLPHARTGGHQLSLIEAHGGMLFGSAETVGFSDPAAHKLYTEQGPFTETQVNVDELTGNFDGRQLTLSRFDGYGSGYLDNYISIRPTFALSADANKFYFNFPIQLEGGPPHEVTRSFLSGTGGKILDLAVSPERAQHPYLIQGSNAVWQIDDLTGQSTRLANVLHPQRLVYGGADQSLYCLTDSAIVRLSRDGQMEDRTPLYAPLDAIAYDQASDSLVGVSVAAKKIYFFDHHLHSVTQSDLPTDNTWAGTGRWSLTAEPGALLLHRDGSSMIYRLSHGDTRGWLASTITLQGAVKPTGLSVNDIGHLFVTENHMIVEYDAMGRRVEGSKFTGLPGGQVVQMLMPFSNFDARIDTGPAYQNVLPENAIPPVGQTQMADLRGSYQGFAEVRGTSQAVPVHIDFAPGTAGQWVGPITVGDMRFTVEATVSPSGDISAVGTGEGIRFSAQAILTNEGDGALSIAGRFQAQLADGSMLEGDLAVVRAPQSMAGHSPGVAGAYHGVFRSTYTGTTMHERKQFVLIQQGNQLTGQETAFNEDGSVRAIFRLVGVVNNRGEFHLVGLGGDGMIQALQGRFRPKMGDRRPELEGVFELRSTSDLHTVIDHGTFEVVRRPHLHLGKHVLLDALPPGMRTSEDLLPPGQRKLLDMLPPGTFTPVDTLLLGQRTPPDTLPPGTRTPGDTLSPGTRTPGDTLPPGLRIADSDDLLEEWPPQ
jgi:hypothetical protein